MTDTVIVPLAAVSAASKAIHTGWLIPLNMPWPRQFAEVAIAAAAPHIAAAERERIRQLATARSAYCPADPANPFSSPRHPFADLLTEGDPQ